MDAKLEIKEDDPLSNDIASQSETNFFTKVVTMKINSDAMLLDNDCDTAIKTEIKSEASLLGFWSQKTRERFAECLIKAEGITSSNGCEKNLKTDTVEYNLDSDFGLQNKREFLPKDPVVKHKECNIYNEMDNILEIKEEPWWVKTEPDCNDNKDGNLSPVKSSRLCMEVVSGDNHVKSQLPLAEVLESVTIFYNEKDHHEYKSQESDATEIPTVEEVISSKQSDKCSDGETYRSLHSKQKNFINKNNRPHMCSICRKSFKYKSDLIRHDYIHGGERPHMCNTCNKSFYKMSHLNEHNLIHEGRKPHQCKTCDKRFTQLSHLKRHNWVHQGKKPHQCKICVKSFTRLSCLKKHYLSHQSC